jgi:predicted transcriptional regulator
MMWNGLPVIRKEIAESMIKDFGLNQKEAAKKLGITPAAVCQYLSKKRGKANISNEIIQREVKVSAGNIIENGDGSILSETCRICKLFRSSSQFSLICPSCDEQ